MKPLLTSAAIWVTLAVVAGQDLTADYTEEARLAGLEGRVEIECPIGWNGLTQGLRVKQSLGLGLDEKAMEAVNQSLLNGSSVTATLPVDFLLLSKQSRWHLIGVTFHPPEGVTRPIFREVKYPVGDGISLRAFDEGKVLGAIGREATVTLAFDVDEHGSPVHFEVQRASYEVWGGEAIDLVSQWRFQPGTKNGLPVTVPVTLELAWGRKELSASALENLKLALSVSETPARPVLVFSPLPPYTEEARKAGLEGDVLVGLIVGEDGSPKNLSVVKSLGMGLDESAIQTLSTWRFQPPLLNGTPAEISTVQVVAFRLNPQTRKVPQRP